MLFNIVLFGSDHVFWKPTCQLYSSGSEAEAVSWIQSRCHADMGGTEILGAFSAIYKHPVSQGYSRQIIFLTGGWLQHVEFHK